MKGIWWEPLNKSRVNRLLLSQHSIKLMPIHVQNQAKCHNLLVSYAPTKSHTVIYPMNSVPQAMAEVLYPQYPLFIGEIPTLLWLNPCFPLLDPYFLMLLHPHQNHPDFVAMPGPLEFPQLFLGEAIAGSQGACLKAPGLDSKTSNTGVSHLPSGKLT